MYKVFIYDKPVFIVKKEVLNHFFLTLSDSVSSNELIEKMNEEKIEGIQIVTEDPKAFLKKLKAELKYIKAAGGVVFNKNNKALFIYRLGKWDLPKGKLEKGEDIEECAVREVEEECNVSGLKIVKELPSTFHCYPWKDKWAIKRTYWYEMTTNFDGELIPQTEEGIEAVEWLAKEEWSKVFENTYKSIEEVLQNSL